MADAVGRPGGRGKAARGPRGRRRWLLGLGAAASALGGAALWAGVLPGRAAQSGPASPPLAPRAGQHRFSLAAAGGTPRPVNRQVLGSNVQWVDNGDELLDAQGAFRPEMLALVQQMAPTGLRYPGGMQSDAYHWERGMGPLAQRGTNEHAHNRVQQPTRMGTLEFLELCEATGARPLLTVNLVTGTAQEAAHWVRAVNVTGLSSRRTGRRLPPVTDWELGNEPYLKPDERPDLVLQPAEFVRRARACAQAMRAVDPSIRLGLPVGPDQRRGFPVTAFPGFFRAVLPALSTHIDWLAVHMAYMPFSYTPKPALADLYWGAMASAVTVQADLQDFAAEVASLKLPLRPGLSSLPMAITEYNALFTLGEGASDGLICAPVGALYLADLMRVLAQTRLQAAHQWSLSGNWVFGAIHSQGFARPGQRVLALMSEALQGEVLPISLTVASVAVPSVGLAAAQTALPLVEGLMCRQADTLRLLLIHKDPTREARGQIELAGFGSFSAARLSTLAAEDLMATTDAPDLLTRRDQPLSLPPSGAPLMLTLPPGSVSLLQLQRGPRAA